MKLNKKFSCWLLLILMICCADKTFAQTTSTDKTNDNIVTESIADSSSMADLGLELSIDNFEANVGSQVIFTVLVNNMGPAQASGVKVKDKLPSGYTYISSATTNGNYDNESGVWVIGNLPVIMSATLTIKALVNATGDYLNLAEVTASNQQDPDSKPGDGVDTDKDAYMVDDPGDDDDGDGQDIALNLFNSAYSSGDQDYNGNNPDTSNYQTLDDDYDPTLLTATGIKAFLKDDKNRTQTYLFDINTIAMRVEFDPKEKQRPMYFDQEGYVYTASKKQGYVKIPFEKLKKLNAFPNRMSNGVLPVLDFPDGSVTYYGMDVSPKRFPILEWAFVYKIRHFEGNTDFNKEILDCRGNNNCTKYIVKAGQDAGSYVLFDAQKRLAEIFTTQSGNIVYTYEDNTVKLPDAREMPFMTDMFFE